MARQESPHFSEAAVQALRYTRAFEEWNGKFESLKRAIRGRVSPRDINPLLKAGADEDRILTLLAFTVDDSNRFPPELMRKRKSLASLADQLVAVANHATRVVNDPECDGRFWLALEGGLSWDSVPKAGVIEAQALTQMRASLKSSAYGGLHGAGTTSISKELPGVARCARAKRKRRAARLRLLFRTS